MSVEVSVVLNRTKVLALGARLSKEPFFAKDHLSRYVPRVKVQGYSIPVSQGQKAGKGVIDVQTLGSRKNPLIFLLYG